MSNENNLQLISCVFSGYVCEKSSNHLKDCSDALRNIIISILKTTVVDAIRLEAYKALHAWFKHLNPTFESKTKCDEMAEVLVYRANDNLDILRAICDCLQIFFNVMRFSRFENWEHIAEVGSTVQQNLNELPTTPGHTISSSPPSPAEPSSAVRYQNRCVKLNVNRKRMLSLSLYKRTLLNAARKSRNR